jgi:hypothetical protein
MAEEKEKMQEEEVDDIVENPKTTGKVLPVEPDIVLDEFELMQNELLDQFKTGEAGNVIIPVQVLRVSGDKVRFKKRGPAEVQTKFESMSIAEMRKNLDVAER